MQVERVCLGMELSPAYVDVAVRRWQELTGEVAINAETGLPFDVLAEELLPDNMKMEVLSASDLTIGSPTQIDPPKP